MASSGEKLLRVITATNGHVCTFTFDYFNYYFHHTLIFLCLPAPSHQGFCHTVATGVCSEATIQNYYNFTEMSQRDISLNFLWLSRLGEATCSVERKVCHILFYFFHNGVNLTHRTPGALPCLCIRPNTYGVNRPKHLK